MPSLTLPPEFHPSTQETNQAVLAAAAAHGCQVYLVGGYVRDWLLHRFSTARPPKDFDYAVISNGSSAITFARQLSDTMSGHFVLLDTSNDTARVVLDNGIQIDLAGCVGGNIQTDVRRRDFTVNALVWDPGDPHGIGDYVGGHADLVNKIIRAVAEQSFIEDPLRLLRAFRFAASLDFSMEEATAALVRKHAEKLSEVAAERVSYELFAILESDRAATTLQMMGETKLLEIVFPEISSMHEVPPNAYHHLPLYDHSMEALMQAENGFFSLPLWAQRSFALPLSQQLSRRGATKLAALLHDIGKPKTWNVQEDGRHTFIGHDKLGADLSLDIAKRLKWSKPVERFIANMIRWHLRPGALFHQGAPTDRAIHRFYRAIGDETPQLILLAQADFRATCGPGLADRENRIALENHLRELLEGYVVFIDGRKSSPRLLDGSDVMELLSIPPGPVVGELLEELEEAQGLKEVMNKQQARNFVSERFKQKYCK